MDAPGAVVAAEDHNRVVFNSSFRDRIENLADAKIHFGNHVGVRADPMR